MAQIAQAARKLQRDAGRRGKETAETVPILRPHPRPESRQTAKEPACRQDGTDGLFLGGCRCDTDLRVKVVLFTRTHIRIHTAAQQNNTLTSV